MPKLDVTDAELATLLAGARFMRMTPEQDLPPQVGAIATGDGAVPPLEDEEIDGLIEKLNLAV